MKKSTGTFSRLLGVLLGACCLFACSGAQGPAGGEAPGKGAQEAGLPEHPMDFDSLRLCLPQSGKALFDSLRRTDPARWQLATDLLAYAYALRWGAGYDELEGTQVDAALVERRLARAQGKWGAPEGATPYAQYTALSRQAKELAAFATGSPGEEALRLGLERFLQQFLDARCRQQLAALTQGKPVGGALQREHAAWREHLQAEREFMEFLYQDSLNLAGDYMGRRAGILLDNRQKRRAEADRNLLFALGGEGEFSLPREEYVTWAATMGQYEQLQARYGLYGATQLKRALTRESVAWFRYMQVRAQIGEQLGESPAGKIYDTTTRMLKRMHLNDLKTW